MTTTPSRLSRAPTTVIEQMAVDLKDFMVNQQNYPTTATFLKDEDWAVLQSTLTILETVLQQRASMVDHSLNTHWAYLVRSEEETFAETVDPDQAEYMVVRFYQDDRDTEVIERGLTLAEAQAHCQRDDTHGDGWFDGYEVES